MNIRRVLRLSCLTVAGLFWASCGNDSSTQAPDSEVPDSDSSTDGISSSTGAGDSVSSSSAEESSAASESSSSDSVESSPSSESGSSSEAGSSSSVSGYVLAKDPSITCETSSQMVKNYCGSSTESFSCDDYKKYLASDTTLSEKLLTAWENELLNCGAILEPVTLYGVSYTKNPCAEYVYAMGMKCSDGNVYTHYYTDGNLIYTSEAEYNEAHGISSSSVAESPSSSSSEPEDLVKNCPHEDFALFVDVLADVHKKLYNEIVNGIFYEKYEVGEKIPDAGKQYIESLLDHENKSLKGKYTPYFDPDYDYDEMMTSLRGLTNFWFDGYVAKTETCEDGTPKTVQLYLNHYNSIYGECAKMIREKAMSLKDPA